MSPIITTLKDDKRSYAYTCEEYDGKEHYMEDNCLIKLLEDGVAWINEGSSPATIGINLNDVFYWACADGEDIAWDEIGPILKMHLTYPSGYGVIKWACLKRNLQPQKPLKKRMIERGAWDEELEALPEPERS